jgi:hypothetical protein
MNHSFSRTSLHASVGRLAALLALLCTLSGAALAWELSGAKTVSAVTRDGQTIAIGSLLFTAQANGRSAFTLTMDQARFVDHFLSMKEFKCLQGPDEVLCHVPYPYKNPATVSATDYAWLEHQFLFLFKQPRDFGAKLWNGLYFHLERDDQGLVGTPQAVDLNLISAPPDDLLTPPYSPQLRDSVASGAHWIDHLLIR